MNKSGKPPSTSPFARPEHFGKPPEPSKAAAPARSATEGFTSGIKAGAAPVPGGAAAPEARSAMAGNSFGKTATSKPLTSGEPAPAKKNPFERKPLVDPKPAATPGEAPAAKGPSAVEIANKPLTSGFASESGNASFAPATNMPKVAAAESGQETTVQRAVSPDDYSKRVEEAQKPVSSAAMEMNSKNYVEVYQQRETERMAAQKAEAEKKAQEAASHTKTQTQAAQNTQAEQARAAAYAQQARDLDAQIVNLRSQVFNDPEQQRLNGIKLAEAERARGQIPSGYT